MSLSDNILEIKNIKKSYTLDGQKISVLKGIDLTMRIGEFASIQGISGVGKSTFLNLIGAVDNCDSGEIFLDGQNLENWRDKNRLHIYRREKIGFIFQHHCLIPDFTVLENVCVPLFIQGENKKRALQKGIFLLEEIGLSTRSEHFPHQISGGESQRVSMLRAMIHQPSLILADEPTGNLDMKNTLKFIELLQKMQRQKSLSILVATHETELANAAQKRYEMIDGNIRVFA